MNLNNALKKAARFVLAAGQAPVHITVGAVSPSGMLAGRHIVITGGGSGIGLAMARKFVSQGASVLIAGRNKEKLEKAVSSLGGNAQYLVFDVSKVENDCDFVVRAESILGGFDGLVCNAGLSLHEGDFRHVTPDKYDAQFNTNFRGAYFLAQTFLEHLEEHKRQGDLLFISSETADHAVDIPYGLTKSAVNCLVGGLSRKLYAKGIRVNAIAPGVTATAMTKNYADVSDGNYANESHAGRVFIPEEVAEVACFLMSNASRCISGEVIHVNGGNHLG